MAISRRCFGGSGTRRSIWHGWLFLEDALVAVLPGGAFGMDGYMRLSYATSEELLTESIKRIREFCSSLQD